MTARRIIFQQMAQIDDLLRNFNQAVFFRFIVEILTKFVNNRFDKSFLQFAGSEETHVCYEAFGDLKMIRTTFYSRFGAVAHG